MKDTVVYKWFRDQADKGVTKSFTIREVYKSLSRTPNSRCLETVWSQIVKLRESGILSTTWTIPVKYKLVDKDKIKLKI